MATMQAAVVTSFAEPPHYQSFDVPAIPGPDHQMVDVLAVGLHPRVRSGATGSHYTSTGELPLIPGVDGVGRLSDGDTVFFVADDDLPGTMADRAVIDTRRSVRLPHDADIAKIAAGVNPAMSSWVALRQRVSMQPGQTVMILGATGNAGAMAVQVAKLLGAAQVVAVGRNRTRLEQTTELGADTLIPILDDKEATGNAIRAAGSKVDIVIDYLWGEPASQTMLALVVGRDDRSKALDWIQIGSVAGPTIELPSALLRSSNLRILGNGQGAVSTRGYLAELPALVEQIDASELQINARTVPLSDVENTWNETDSGNLRTVFIP